VALPRLSALFKIIPKLTTRLSAGMGYKAPTIFTEESEKLLYKDVLPVNSSSNKLEKSYGINWDVTYKTKIENLAFSINQLFFYTYLKDPLMLEAQQVGLYQFLNIHGHTDTKGMETNIKLALNEFSFYLGYTYIDAKVNNSGSVYQNTLTPKHRLNAALVFEIEDKLRVGSELYYFSKQNLTDGTTGRDYWLAGLVAEKFWKRFSLYINFENVGDIRQTRFESIYNGSISNPIFKDIYAPLDGFIVNGGIKLKL
jgi:iron complex outermembrane receptor protein